MKFRLVSLKKQNFFLPENYPNSVTQNYWNYIKWTFSQYISSTALGVLSTQQLLIALGYTSATGTLTASAALNWIIKDGVGLFGGVVYAGKVGKKFDENTRHYKWVSCVALNISCALEILAPLSSSLFLPLASVATIGKNISGLAGSASRAAINLSMARENNIGDVTVKAGTETSIACLIGTGVGSLIGYFI